jgi:hypothetical protein
MTRRQRYELIEERADLTLTCQPDIEAYAVHFEAQMSHGKLRKLLFNSRVCLARVGAFVNCVDHGVVQ